MSSQSSLLNPSYQPPTEFLNALQSAHLHAHSPPSRRSPHSPTQQCFGDLGGANAFLYALQSPHSQQHSLTVSFPHDTGAHASPPQCFGGKSPGAGGPPIYHKSL